MVGTGNTHQGRDEMRSYDTMIRYRLYLHGPDDGGYRYGEGHEIYSHKGEALRRMREWQKIFGKGEAHIEVLGASNDTVEDRIYS